MTSRCCVFRFEASHISRIVYDLCDGVKAVWQIDSVFSHELEADFWDHLTVEEIHYSLGVAGIALGVGYHQDGSAFLVQLSEQLHHL